LFSGLTKCGVCGAGFIVTGKHRLGCFGARDQGRCDNHLTIRRDEVEARVLKALQEKLLNQELFDEFCQEFTREMNRLRMERRASLSSGKREVERIGTRIKKLLNLMLDDGIAVDEGKTEIKALDARRKELQAQLDTADDPPPLLHPEMAQLYRQKLTTLAHALEAAETRTEAREALRGLIDVITLTPEQGVLRIELKGNLAAMLGATVQSKRSPDGCIGLHRLEVCRAKARSLAALDRYNERPTEPLNASWRVPRRLPAPHLTRCGRDGGGLGRAPADTRPTRGPEALAGRGHARPVADQPI
jgi:site-specific DNA recombinase